jgi:molybdenum cofactor guanylyltransferase
MTDRYQIDQPFGLVLAGGRSIRMGDGDKVLLAFGGLTILDQVIDRIAPQVQELALSANGDVTRFSRFGLPVLPDLTADYPGPLAGLAAGLVWLSKKGTWLLMVAGDTPFLPGDLVPRLLDGALSAQCPVAFAEDDTGLHPTAGLWHVSVAPLVDEHLALGQFKVADLAAAAGLVRVRFPGEGAFFNVNTPDDLNEARRRAAL